MPEPRREVRVVVDFWRFVFVRHLRLIIRCYCLSQSWNRRMLFACWNLLRRRRRASLFRLFLLTCAGNAVIRAPPKGPGTASRESRFRKRKERREKKGPPESGQPHIKSGGKIHRYPECPISQMDGPMRNPKVDRSRKSRLLSEILVQPTPRTMIKTRSCQILQINATGSFFSRLASGDFLPAISD